MKKLLFLSIIVLVFFGCKKDNKDDDPQSETTCEDNYNPLTIDLSTFGEVKHPFTSDINFANSETSFYPGYSGPLFNVLYSEIAVTIDGGDTLYTTPGYNSVIVDGISAGTHTITMDIECTKEIFIADQTLYCDCIDEELSSVKEIEFVEPTYIRIDSLIFNQNLPCSGNNGSFCPDVYFDWSYYDLPNFVTGNYYYPEDAPIQITYGDTIAIYPSECTIPIDIFDSDQFNDNDYLGNAEMNPTNMNGWVTGSHEIETNFWIVITRLN